MGSAPHAVEVEAVKNRGTAAKHAGTYASVTSRVILRTTATTNTSGQMKHMLPTSKMGQRKLVPMTMAADNLKTQTRPS